MGSSQNLSDRKRVVEALIQEPVFSIGDLFMLSCWKHLHNGYYDGTLQQHSGNGCCVGVSNMTSYNTGIAVHSRREDPSRACGGSG